MGIPIGRYLGDVAAQVLPGGQKTVDTVKTGIEIVKNAKIELKPILKDAGEAAVNAAAARIHEGLNQSTAQQVGMKIQEAAVPILLVVGLLFLLMRGRR